MSAQGLVAIPNLDCGRHSRWMKQKLDWLDCPHWHSGHEMLDLLRPTSLCLPRVGQMTAPDMSLIDPSSISLLRTEHINTKFHRDFEAHNARDPMRTEQETYLSGLVQCGNAMLANIQGFRMYGVDKVKQAPARHLSRIAFDDSLSPREVSPQLRSARKCPLLAAPRQQTRAGCQARTAFYPADHQEQETGLM